MPAEDVIDAGDAGAGTAHPRDQQRLCSGALIPGEPQIDLCVVTTLHTLFVGTLIQVSLANVPIAVHTTTTMPASFAHDLYIVVCPQMFDVMPPASKTICFQMEQVHAGDWGTEEYWARLRESLAVIEFSLDNIAILTARGIPANNIYYVPVLPLARGEIDSPGLVRDIDVLFYGSPASRRRARYLSALKHRFQLRVKTNLFGDDMHHLLERTKIVVNIHMSDDGLLETTRLSEALTHGAHVVSERGADQVHQTDFDDLVDFVEANDVDAFVARVEQKLAAWSSPTRIDERASLWSPRYFLLRMLHGLGFLSFRQLDAILEAATFKSDRVVLCQPEQISRFKSALHNLLPNTELFAGLRHAIPWKGCAESYKFMARRALRRHDHFFTIYEDDSIFEQDVDSRLDAVYAHLNANAGNWDIYSGLLCDLHLDANISRVVPERGEEFIYLDRFIGTHFAIYTRLALAKIAAFEILGDDPFKHTIDRYLEAMRLRIVTTLKPLAMENAEVPSSLWPRSNSEAAQRIQSSILRLRRKWAAYVDLSRIRISDMLHDKLFDLAHLDHYP